LDQVNGYPFSNPFMKKSLITVISLGIIHCTFAQTTPVSPVKAPVHLSIDLGQPGKKLSPMLYGLMTEEINHSYDGGLYAELIQNRVFKDKVDTAVHWSLIGDPATANMILVNSEPINRALTTSLKLELQKGSGEAEFANDGYWGIPVKPGTAYRASFYAKSTFKGAELTVKIESKDGKSTFAFGKIQGLTGQWKKYTVTLNTPANIASTLNARFSIMATQPGSYWFNLVSLFPPTYKNRPNGNRVDLMEMQAAMNPRFLRFPGGDYLEGKRLEDRFAFKNTIGDISTRPGKNSRWYYRSSDGMGLLEFLQWCEDLRMQPLLAVYAGYSVGKGYLATGEDMKPFVSEALDEIEYVIGDQSTPFGARRAAEPDKRVAADARLCERGAGRELHVYAVFRIRQARAESEPEHRREFEFDVPGACARRTHCGRRAYHRAQIPDRHARPRRHGL